MKVFTRLFILFLAFLTILPANAQQTLSGEVVDEGGLPLVGASVILLMEQDSSLLEFAITDDKGRFRLPSESNNAKLLQISFLGYQDYWQSLTPTEIAANPFITVQLEEISTKLEEVLVTEDRIPMRINQDTVEYDARAFSTRPNATVEELLQQLPGVAVDRNGNIDAQGERVDRILVDGKEFFGDDVTLATQNLPADAIEKVQVFDRASETAEFTGIPDGQEEKTINLELKEDHKQGYFGQLSGGYGTDERYRGKASINRFSSQQQLSILGLGNNINEAGFSIEEYLSFLGGMSRLMQGGGGMARIQLNANDAPIPLNMGDNTGITTTQAGGLNLNHDWSERTSFSGNYFYSQMDTRLQQDQFQRNWLAEGVFLQNENRQDRNKLFGHRANMTFRHKLDSMQDISLETQARLFNSEQQTDLFNQRFLENNELISEADQNQALMAGRWSWNTDLTYRRRLGRPGRNLIVELGIGQQTSDQDRKLISFNQFRPDGGGAFLQDSLLQEQEEATKGMDYRAQISYTEPIGKGQHLEVRLQREQSNTDFSRQFFDLPQVNSEDRTINNLLSTDFIRDYRYDRNEWRYRLQRKKNQLMLGLGGQRAQLLGTIAGIEQAGRTFWNLLPSLRWQLDLSSTKNLSLDYNTLVREPSLEQLQPIVDNSNPLTTYVGNPDLSVAYTHRLGMNYLSFSQFNQTSFFANWSTTYTKDPIVNSRTVDELLQQTIRPENVSDDWLWETYLSFSAPVRPLRSELSLSFNANWNRGKFLLNDVEQLFLRKLNRLEASISNRKKEVLDLVVGASLTYDLTNYPTTVQQKQQIWNQVFFGDVSVRFAKSWQLRTQLDYNIYQDVQADIRQDIPLMQAEITKYLMNERLQVSLAAYDVLNKNRGIDRRAELNYIQETQSQVLQRYFLLKCQYALSAFGGDALPGVQITRRRG